MHIRLFGTGLVLMLAVSPGLCSAQGGHDQHKQDGHNHPAASGHLPKCPVMGEESIDLSISLATADGPVYFCSKDCIEGYKADPGKYTTHVAAQQKQLAGLPKVQAICPITGQEADRIISTTYQGRKILFCCKGCIGKFEKNPEKYVAALANSYSYQTKCPVMGGDINPQAAIKLADGRKIYFCCPGCDKKLASAPSIFLPKLAAQGVFVAAKDLAGAKAIQERSHRN
jgi:YHS domain-containing protein